ncbi:uncharacterized protein EI90DRAFT_1915239 [Cantharellus anzutake]|uniref:uncharacterized protein n=1 Tax=Cantharellus anzutake TaxID=1750568 RepID=UPI001907B7CD|nr:uncharacterized protein EI90DRAFT_1915239 [Cantharellus anzutake]KAF8326636.1 hypothetical protein EI90DRAFT_1915239 [Cantharellus anzutake]
MPEYFLTLIAFDFLTEPIRMSSSQTPRNILGSAVRVKFYDPHFQLVMSTGSVMGEGMLEPVQVLSIADRNVITINRDGYRPKRFLVRIRTETHEASPGSKPFGFRCNYFMPTSNGSFYTTKSAIDGAIQNTMLRASANALGTNMEHEREVERRLREQVVHPVLLKIGERKADYFYTYWLYDEGSIMTLQMAHGTQQLTGKPYTLQKTKALIIKLIGVLTAIHSAGLQHINLSPRNIVLMSGTQNPRLLEVSGLTEFETEEHDRWQLALLISMMLTDNMGTDMELESDELQAQIGSFSVQLANDDPLAADFITHLALHDHSDRRLSLSEASSHAWWSEAGRGSA